jgi:hypothetical protein
LPCRNKEQVETNSFWGTKMTNENEPSHLNLVRSSVKAGWTSEEREKRRRLAGNKQLQLKELAFLTVLDSHNLRDTAANGLTTA